jgi:N-acetylglucosamine-6-sulfatase
MKHSLPAWLLAVCGAHAIAGAAAQTARPNIVFIFSDDHALRAISAYGDALNETPQIDRLAAGGAVFTRSYGVNSICGPSRAAVLTGMHSHRNGFMRNDGKPFDGAQTTFPRLLQGAGYQTALFGKWHLQSVPTGFDHCEILPGQGFYYNPDFIRMDGSTHRMEGYSTDIITDLAIDWLDRQRAADQPFLLMVQYKAPHRTFAPALRHLELYTGHAFPEPATLFDDYANRSRLLRSNEMEIGSHMLWEYDLKVRDFNPGGTFDRPDPEYRRMRDDQRRLWDAHFEPANRAFTAAYDAGEMSDADILRWKYQRYIRNYLRTVRAVDEGVGRVLDYLDAHGLADNTIVVYSSDQGFFLGEHGWFDKRWMFEESFAMPFIMRWPGVAEPGTRRAELIQNIDYAPTFLDAAGVPVPPRMQGSSLRPLLAGDGAGWREALLYAYYETTTHNVPEHSGVSDGRWKLLHFPATGEWNLFDLGTDPHELRSLHDDPASAGELARMRALYAAQCRQYVLNRSTVPTARNELAWWATRHQEKLDEVAARAAAVRLVFVGDSITHNWERRQPELWQAHYARHGALNLGYSGDRTEHVLWRLHNGEWPAELQPRVAVLMIGTNNTGHGAGQPAAETAAGIRLIVEDIRDRAPDTEIILLAIFPRGATADDPRRLRNDEINRIIAGELGGRAKVHYVDIGAVFLDADGNLPESIMPDFLHPDTRGYELWAEALQPHLRAMLMAND